MPIPDRTIQPIRILILDDEEDFRITWTDLLDQPGRELETFRASIDALDALASRYFDIAVIDMRLNGDEDDGSGIVLATAALRLLPNLRVIFVSRYDHESQAQRALGILGSVEFFDKGNPGFTRQLIKTVDEGPRKDLVVTNLSLSLATGQPSCLKCTGAHVASTRSRRTFRADPNKYRRGLENARGKRDKLQALGESVWDDVIADYAEIDKEYGKAAIAAVARRGVLSLRVETEVEMLPVPLELMRSGDNNASDYLVLEHPLSRFVCGDLYQPTRAAFSPIYWARKDRLRVLLIASNTHTTSGTFTLQPIPQVDDEVDELEKILAKHKNVEVTVLKTAEASIDAVHEALKRPYEIIHYAGHATFFGRSPENSSLYFWSGLHQKPPVIGYQRMTDDEKTDDDKAMDDGSMTATRLGSILQGKNLDHDIAARLVFLSCCHGAASGSTPDLLDNDCLGLADAVVKAGVPSVVGYRWQVNSRRAVALAKKFYEVLLVRGSPEIALWQARRLLAEQNRDELTWLSPILIHQA